MTGLEVADGARKVRRINLEVNIQGEFPRRRGVVQMVDKTSPLSTNNMNDPSCKIAGSLQRSG